MDSESMYTHITLYKGATRANRAASWSGKTIRFCALEGAVAKVITQWTAKRTSMPAAANAALVGANSVIDIPAWSRKSASPAGSQPTRKLITESGGT